MNRIICTLLFSILFQSLSAQNSRHVYFQNQDDDKINAITVTVDNYYLIAGSTRNSANLNTNAFVAKINREGDTVWTKTFGDTAKVDVFYDIYYCDDEGFIVTGKAQSYSTRNKEDIIVIKFSKLGDQEWIKSYTIGDYATAKSIVQTQDKGYILSGFTYLSNDFQVLAIKLNSGGDTAWTKTFGGIVYDYGSYAIEKNNGGFLVTGRTQSYGNGNFDALLVNLSASGALNWYKTYGGSNFDEGVQVVQHAVSNDIYIVGSTSSKGSSGRNLYLIKANENGTKQWDKAFGGTLEDYGNSLIISSDNHVVATGWSNSFMSGETKFYILKTTLSGTTIWEKVSGTSSTLLDQAYRITENKDNEYVLAGVNRKASTLYKGYVIFTDSSGCSLRTPLFTVSGNSQPGKFCEDTSVTLSVTGSYANYLWSNSKTSSKTTISNTGYYYVKVTDNFNCSSYSDSTLLTKYPLPQFSLNPSGSVYYCPGKFDSLELNATAGFVSYKWNSLPAGNMTYFYAKTYGAHKVVVTDTNNCRNSADILIEEYTPYEHEEICVVTVDTNTNKNLIAWERTRGQRTSHYNVYKESSIAGIYNLIGIRKFGDVSVFVDKSSIPLESSARYKITSVDSCGTESSFSPFHQTLHLQVNQGVGSQINLDWQDKYIGFNYLSYNIFRGTNPANLSYFTTISSSFTSWTDLNPPSGPVFYQVAAVMPDTCSPTILRAQSSNGPFSQSTSNIKDYRIQTTDYLYISPSAMNIYYDEDTNTISVFSNSTDWTTSTNESWIKIVEFKSEGYFLLITEKNLSMEARSGTVEITVPGVKTAYLHITQYDAVGLNEFQPQTAAVAYPNPFSDYVFLKFNAFNENKVNIRLINLVGKEVMNVDETFSKFGDNELYLDLSNHNLVPGIYFLRINTGSQNLVLKIVRK
ncbi:T9SS type A sorting domain-containing protein [Bacteroidota bacterium]